MNPQTSQAPNTKLALNAFTLTPDPRKWTDVFLLAGGCWAWRRALIAQLATVYPKGAVSPILILE